ncbi:MAG: hypothetical protein AAGH89_06555, partial [Verrucomicrobiota bacterium]
PAQECTSFSVTVPTSDQALFSDMVHAQIEKRGLAGQSGERTVSAFHVIERDRGGSLLGVDVLPREFNEDLCLNQAQAYTASGRLFHIPDHAAAVYREHGRLILLAGKHGKMTYSQILTAGTEFTPALVQELNLAILSLQGADQLSDRVTLEIWSEVTPEALDLLKNTLTVPVESRSRPNPDAHLIGEASDPMLPTPVVAALRRQQRIQKIRTGVLALVAVYITIAVGLTILFHDRKERAGTMEERISERRPEAEFIRQSMTRARVLAPSIDKRFYPLRQLNQVTSLMPPSGIVVLKFITQEQSLRLEGLARDSQLVYQLKEDLEKSDDFRGYSWDMAPPQVNSQNNTASFRLEGKFAAAQ